MANDFDVIVIGAGGAGLAAAATAAEFGSTVMVVDADSKIGGTTRLSSGHIYACNTSVQRAAGIEDDTPDAMYAYYMGINQYHADAESVRRFCDESGSTIEWLIELGEQFNPDELYSGGLDGPDVRRSHRPSASGQGVVDLIAGTAQEKGAQFVQNTRVRRLVTGDRGEVVGIEVEGEIISAGSVIISSGGFGANRDMLSKYFPKASRHGNWTWYAGSDHCRGDMLTAGMDIGGVIVGKDTGLNAVTHGWNRDMEPFHPPWLLYVNKEGRRFMNEALTYGLLAGKIDEQTDGSCFAIMDETSRAAAAPNPAFVGLMDQNWTAEKIQMQVDSGRVVSGGTLTELAEKTGINPRAFVHTIETYNASCDAGVDAQFGKPELALRKVSTGPFYAAEMKPAIVSATFAGLATDRDTRVLDADGLPIPNLYAAGEAARGAMGDWYVGGGNAVSHALTFGRIAGRNAAA